MAIRAQTTSDARICCADHSHRRSRAQLLAFIKVADALFRITGCWVNVLGPGAAHATHSHPNKFLSGVCYLQTQAGTDTINFHDPRPQTAIIRPPTIELTAYNTDQAVVTVSDGTLLDPYALDPYALDR